MDKNLLKETKEGLVLTVKVVANASNNKIEEAPEYIKLRITAPAVDNKANNEIIKFLSKKFKLSKNDVQILRGDKSSHKLILLKNITLNEFLLIFNS